MATDTARMAVYNKPAVVITDRKLSLYPGILTAALEKLAQTGKKASLNCRRCRW